MKMKVLPFVLAALLSANFVSAQFVVIEETFSPNGVSNQGKVSGYKEQTGPYSIWLPDSGNVIVNIGGIAPGQGVGGQARISADGEFISGTSVGPDGPEMSRYSRTTNTWTRLGSLGYEVDNNVSGGFAISADGGTVAGLAWGDTTGGRAFSQAVAWNPAEGIIDLGTLYNGKSTRANAISEDGSVIVGWQDTSGPWKSAVWRKNPAGGYYANEYLLINEDSSATNEYNQLGECSAVSADGKWIGGYGDYANNNQPWIWSKDGGVINLGTLPNVGNGYVSGMSADAKVVVGWFDGQLFGDPLTPFIWTQAAGLHELNGYITTLFGDTTGIHHIYTADCISPNGQYVAGYGVNDSSFTYFSYRLSLYTSTGVPEVSTTNNVHVYPNPAANLITIEMPDKASLTITSIDGKLMDQQIVSGKQVLDISAYAAGIYCLSFESVRGVEVRKVVKE